MEQTIVGTAMPTIIGELNGFTIFAWVTTALSNSLNDCCTHCWKAI
ncbi:hypothetical protein RCO48_37210 [Peribacillus frigoritolerans]|nr:hypothetical protein [Peribacillus frigoritolerans]